MSSNNTVREKLEAKIEESRKKVKELDAKIDANPCRTQQDRDVHDQDWDAINHEEEKLKKLEKELAGLFTDDS